MRVAASTRSSPTPRRIRASRETGADAERLDASGRSGFAPDGPTPTLASVIRRAGLAKRYGAKRVLRGLDLDVPAGGFTLVTGPNGSGKTTLLRLVAGLAAPSRGELEVAVERGASASSRTSRSSTGS